MSEVHLCQAFVEIADDLVGHDLSPEETARWSAHARQCSRCGAQWRQALTRSAALSLMTPWSLEASGVKPPAPGATAEAVFARLAAGEGIPRLRERWRFPLAAAAAVVVMAGGALLTKAVWLDGRSATVPELKSAGSEVAEAHGDEFDEEFLQPLGPEQQRFLLQTSPNPRVFQFKVVPNGTTNVQFGGGAGSGSHGAAPAKPQRF
jgi:hypothetical protein